MPGGSDLYDTGTHVNKDAERFADTADLPASDNFWRRLRHTTKFSLKFYGSASRLALGQSRWIAASAVLGVMSLGLVGTGIAALVAPYDGVATASLTAERAPRVVATSTAGTAGAVAAAEIRPATDENAENSSIVAIDDAKTDTTGLRTASLADPGLFDPLTEERLAEEAAALPAEPQPVEQVVTLESGQTLMEVLQNAGIDRIDSYHAVAALTTHYSPRKLRAGQEIALTFMEQPDAMAEGESGTPAKYLASLSLEPDLERMIEVTRNGDGSFASRETLHEFTEGFVRAAGSIDNSLFLDGERAGVPVQIIAEMIRMYSYSVDFQREIQPGDKFEVYFSRKFDQSNRPVKEGDVHFASLTVGGKVHKLWRFDPGNGEWDYFDENGQSMKKFLMKTPIDGARLSSGFGMRRHPILGYSKLHAGVDFAAPRGTPIYAAGDGTVKRANYFGSFGNYVLIRHANGYETAYAHLNGFARGIKAGTRVRQGQVIGYVGTTGRSTGPHLHYEVHVNGKKMNPLALKVPTGRKLEGKELAAFKARRETLATQMAEAPSATKVAEARTGGNAN
jgi:murein DD-endopeptidase MepM/ murein hydrolase activator NlpD